MMKLRGWIVSTLLLGAAAWSLPPVLAGEPILILAHRGGMLEFEENTMEGFRGCYEQGIRAFETDIRMTSDGELVVLHDDSLDRTHNAKGPVEKMTASEVRQITTKKGGQKFLFLDELLDYFGDKPGVLIELEMKTKNRDLYPNDRLEEYCRKLLAAARSRQPEGSTYILTSFDERPLKIIRGLDDKVSLSLITSKPCTPEFVQQAQEIGVNFIGCKMDGLTRAMVREAQQAGLRVNGWPGHQLQDYHLAVGLGCDIHCTDLPLEVLKHLEKSPSH